MHTSWMGLESVFIQASSTEGGTLETECNVKWDVQYIRLKESIHKDWWKSFFKLQFS